MPPHSSFISNIFAYIYLKTNTNTRAKSCYFNLCTQIQKKNSVWQRFKVLGVHFITSEWIALLEYLARLFSILQIKCEHYWPMDSMPCLYGNLRVSLQSEQRENCLTQREFIVRNVSPMVKLTIQPQR